MREVTNLMINDFKIMRTKCDFMGYKVARKESLSFHHMIYPKRDCLRLGLGDGYLYWNGAILVQGSSHEFLHKIEVYDREMFEYLTCIMINMNKDGNLDKKELLRIRGVLQQFMKEHEGEKTKHGSRIIKPQYRDFADLESDKIKKFY